MNAILDILIKGHEINKINIKEYFIEWGNERLSQDPKKYMYNSQLVFHENIDMNYYEDFVKNVLNVQEFKALTLEGNKIEELDKLVNSGNSITYTNDLISFINEMYKHLDTFCLIKLRNEECIDEIHIINDASEAIDIFVESLKRSSPKGIVIIKK